MPKLVIDNIEIEVTAGTMVIEAAAQLGIMIPRFCYHPALGSVGACRVCAVKLLDGPGPLKGIQMSCMVEAQDGMVVSTTDEEAEDFRRHVIEWLMLNHPHDCPVCDEGGHCLLQDMTVSGGHGIRQYQGNKRTYADQYLGPLVQHEMNRCIHCYRCARYYQEFTGYRDLGVMRSASRTYFGRFKDGNLASPFTGNLSDICPTGVFTDKPSRFFGRRWDYQRSPSICINCSLGCHTTISFRYREARRQEARFSDDINGHFICDRGRYGFFYTSLESRPRSAILKGQPASLDIALPEAARQLGRISKEYGPSSIAAVGSPRCSLETQFMLKQISRSKGWRDPAFFMDSAQLTKVKSSIAGLSPELSVSMREIEKADFMLVVGADPINEAPMLALALRQAQRKGAKVVVLDPRPITLPFRFTHLAVGVNELSHCLGWLLKSAGDKDAISSLGPAARGFYDSLPDNLMDALIQKKLFDEAAADLQKSERPVVVCGTDVGPTALPAQAADIALGLQTAKKETGLFYLMPGANGFGAGLLSDSEASFLQIIEDIETGAIKSMIIAESDPLRNFGDLNRLESALDALDLLIVLDYVNSEVSLKGQIVLPTSTVYETGGVFINQEGRAQHAPRAYSGGLPIVQSGGGDHPPRSYGQGLPGSEPLPAWMILALISGEAEIPDAGQISAKIHQGLVDFFPEFAEFKSLNELPAQGLRIQSGVKSDLRFGETFSSPAHQPAGSDDFLELIFIDNTFGTEELSAFSECLWKLEPESAVILNAADALGLGLANGDRVTIQTDTGNLEVKLTVAESMARGVLIVPRQRNLLWQTMGAGKRNIDRARIKKITVS